MNDNYEEYEFGDDPRNEEPEPASCLIVQTDESEEWFMDKNRVVFKRVGEHILNTIKESGSRICTITDKDTKNNKRDCYIYNEGKYIMTGESTVEQMAQDLLGSQTNEGAVHNVVGYVKRETLIVREAFNKIGDEINLENGIYNIRTGEFRPSTINDLFTYKFPIVYDPSAKCPNIESFFKRVLPKDDAHLIYEEIAYCFIPGYPIQRMFWWIGDGGNGKGTVFRVMEHLIGNGNISNASLHALEYNENYAQANLFGKRCNIGGDISSKDLYKTDFLKRITGGDSVDVKRIWKEPFTLINEAKLFFAMNEPPSTSDMTDGFWRRPLVTEFNANLTAEEVAVFDESKLHTEEEISGLFNCLMKCIPPLLERGDFSKVTTPDELRDVMNDTTSINFFFQVGVVSRQDLMYEKTKIYEDYVAICNKYHMAQMLRNKFFAYLIHERKMETKQRNDPETGKKLRYYIGFGPNITPKIKL